MRQEIAECDRPLRRIRLVQRAIRMAQDAFEHERLRLEADRADAARQRVRAQSQHERQS